MCEDYEKEIMKPNRTGKTIEYKSGPYYLSHTDWGDGHEEIELHRCRPELLFHTCDAALFPQVKEMFEKMSAGSLSIDDIQTEIQDKVAIEPAAENKEYVLTNEDGSVNCTYCRGTGSIPRGVGRGFDKCEKCEGKGYFDHSVQNNEV